jgi:hypothetical protein
MHVCLDRPDGTLDDEFYPDGCREVVDRIGAVDQLRNNSRIIRGALRVLESAALLQMADVLDRPRGEVVECVNFVSLLEERLAEVAPDEPGSAGDQISHSSPWGEVRPRRSPADQPSTGARVA